jgi:hypothetical protein
MVRRDSTDPGLLVGMILLLIIATLVFANSILTLPERCGPIPHDRNGEATGPRICQSLGGDNG